jgi:NADH-quinone oxidoreductase subunit F
VKQTKILLEHIDEPLSGTLDAYMKHKGYKALTDSIRNLPPEEIIHIIRESNLRGRGGAGFPTGMKWSFGASDPQNPKYIICNADEGEPGTFKDRVLMNMDPHAVLEGMALAGYALGAEYGIIYLRGEYQDCRVSLERAINEAQKKNILGKNILGSDFNFDISLFMGAGAYICGEETALIESMEGKIGRSRIKPPFPVNKGLFGKPTIVNNVETLAYIPKIVLNGADWFKKIGTPESPGTKIYSISGHVKNRGNYELPMGTTVYEAVFEAAGGIRHDNKFKAVLPGGASSPVLTQDRMDVKLDFHNLPLAGSMLGSGAMIVMDHTTCMVGAAENLSRFYQHESCGRCTPCREGTEWTTRITKRIKNFEANMSELDLLADITNEYRNTTFCAFGIAAPSAIVSLIKFFREDFETHIRDKRCPTGVCQARN